jgi:23S rRNA (cytidine1920-2'-O)/16S rRNA (cytidine1409-2'-O)-methyltransferase
MDGVCHDREMSASAARRQRLDQLLVERGLAETRSRAQALVLAGRVRVGDGDAARHDLKAGDLVGRDATVQVAGSRDWVSRGAHKLLAALDAFEIDPSGLVALDVGASTGGFTDVLLARGAARVYAVDVGYGQLADKLRRDDRVVSMERVNARTLEPGSLPEPVDLAVIDVSFISLGLVLGPVGAVLRGRRGSIVALVKPQFEAGRADAKGGVVRDPEVHRRVLREMALTARDLGLGTRGVIASPILGPEGNREFLAWLAAGPSCAELDERIVEAVDAAWKEAP